jgi:hypothetical protein
MPIGAHMALDRVLAVNKLTVQNATVIRSKAYASDPVRQIKPVPTLLFLGCPLDRLPKQRGII